MPVWARTPRRWRGVGGRGCRGGRRRRRICRIRSRCGGPGSRRLCLRGRDLVLTGRGRRCRGRRGGGLGHRLSGLRGGLLRRWRSLHQHPRAGARQRDSCDATPSDAGALEQQRHGWRDLRYRPWDRAKQNTVAGRLQPADDRPPRLSGAAVCACRTARYRAARRARPWLASRSARASRCAETASHPSRLSGRWAWRSA